MTLPAAERPNLLIVDDVPANIEILLGMLDGEYELRFATSGRQALSLLARGPRPDLILLDVMMPGMDGYEVCAELKRDPATRHIPVIFVTAKTDTASETAALAAGAVDFIHKPVIKEVVRARVRLHLALEQRTRELSRSLVEIRKAESRLKVLSTAIEQCPTSIVITDAAADIEYVNPRFCEESGYTMEEALGRNPRFLHSGLTDPATFKAMWARLTQAEPWSGELINRRKSGEVYWEEVHISPVRDEEGVITHYVAVKLDITERKELNQHLSHMAHYDVLTDLPNRSLFFERVSQGLALARRNRSRLALLFIDLDRFKPINDTWGHEAGDLTLKEVARRLQRCVRASDTVGRIGGDEFVVLLLDTDGEQAVLGVAEKIRALLSEPIALGVLRVSVSCSIGVALYPEHGDDEQTLARKADRAMYHAKESGRDGVCLYRDDMHRNGAAEQD